MSLLQDIQHFKKVILRKTETTVTYADGNKVVETEDGERQLMSLSGDKQETGAHNFFVIDASPDEKPCEVLPGLFIGSQDAAFNLEGLQDNHISHILVMATGIKTVYPESFVYKVVPLYDLPGTDIRPCIEECIEFIDDAIKNGAVLVHCNAGVSRSSTIVLAYLLNKEKMSLEDALALVRKNRPQAQPNIGFMSQLRLYEEELKQKT